MLNKTYIITIIYLFIAVLCKGDEKSVSGYGLTFKSHEVIQDERTSLLLTPDGALNLSPGFSIEFALKLRPTASAYGYVFNIISNDSVCFSLSSNLNYNKLNFVLAGSNVLKNIEFQEKNTIFENHWMKIKIRIKSDEIVCTVDSVTKKMPYSFKNLKNIDILFGKNTLFNFYSTDVSPMTIKDILLKDDDEKILRRWPLFRHNIKEVYDNTGSFKAIVENGIWEADQYFTWKKLRTIVINAKNPQIASDTLHGRIFVASADSLFTFHLDDGLLERNKVNAGAPFMSGGSQLFYNSNTNSLCSYSILYQDLVCFDFDQNEWSAKLEEKLPPIQQHARFFDPKTNKLIVFGGYGIHKYNAEMAIYDLEQKQWEIDTLSSISPRYLSAMGYRGDGKLLVMGGYGSISGKQEELSKNFYDLYEIDYKKSSSKKLTDFPLEQIPRALGNSLVVDNARNKIYTLAFNNDKFHSFIYLIEVDMNSYEQTILADSIPYNFLDIESYCDLIYYRKNNNLYAVVLQKVSDSFAVSFYSLAYPPLRVSDVIQGARQNQNYFIPVMSLVVILLLFVVGFYRHKRLKRQKLLALVGDGNHSLQPNAKIRTEKMKSSILLLGGLQVLDQNGTDITGSFALVLKNLFLFILLNSVKNDKGVTSNKIDDTFWEGMDNAVNNRGVNIRRLRLLLKEIGDIEIINDNGYWYVQIGEEIFCDYEQIMLLLKKAKKEKKMDLSSLEQVISLASAGVLLPNTEADWIDDYKTEYSGLLIDLLMKAAAQPEYSKDLKLQLQISDVVLLHDSINEDAIRIKCRVLYQMGQKGLSKQAYDHFCSSYFNLLDSKPDFIYEDIIRK